MSGLAPLTDEELARLRERVMQLMRTGQPQQRALAADQLEAIDVERERRLSMASH